MAYNQSFDFVRLQIEQKVFIMKVEEKKARNIQISESHRKEETTFR